MKPEYASSISTRDRKIIPPSSDEYAEAARRGQPLTGDLLKELRSAAKVVRRSTLISQPASQPGSTNEASTIRTLKSKVTALETENTKLKMNILTGK